MRPLTAASRRAVAGGAILGLAVLGVALGPGAEPAVPQQQTDDRARFLPFGQTLRFAFATI